MSKQGQGGVSKQQNKQGEGKLKIKYEQTIDMTKIDLEQFDNSYQGAAEYYFQHAKKLYEANYTLTLRVGTLAKEKLSLSNQLRAYENLASTKAQNESGGHNEEKKRRKRRSASEIQRLYRCKADNCEKSYGSEGTLSQHLKLKHPQIYTTLFGDSEEKVAQQSKSLEPIKEDIQERSNQSNSELHNPLAL